MSRRGTTLIEMIAVITVGAVMLGIGVCMLHVLWRAERTGRDRVHQASVSARLAEQFRSDVCEAVRYLPPQDKQPTQWQFALPGDRVVTYRALPGEVRRDQRTADKLVRQESYVLPSGCSAAIAVQGEAAPAVASLVIAADAAPLAADREFRVTEAVLGKDHRFTKSPIGSR